MIIKQYPLEEAVWIRPIKNSDFGGKEDAAINVSVVHKIVSLRAENLFTDCLRKDRSIDEL